MYLFQFNICRLPTWYHTGEDNVKTRSHVFCEVDVVNLYCLLVVFSLRSLL